jgi:ketosteroid isomerase-like protein
MATQSIPITGKDFHGDLTSPEQALAHFYCAFNSRDLPMVESNWETSTEVVMDNPLGGISRGWEQIRATYERLFGGTNNVEVEFWDYTIIGGDDDVFLAIGRERGRLMNTSGQIDLRIRTRRAYRRSDRGQWHQVHHHGSIDDPQLLSRYQSAVKAG